jgi:hypothetical protein
MPHFTFATSRDFFLHDVGVGHQTVAFGRRPDHQHVFHILLLQKVQNSRGFPAAGSDYERYESTPPSGRST